MNKIFFFVALSFSLFKPIASMKRSINEIQESNQNNDFYNGKIVEYLSISNDAKNLNDIFKHVKNQDKKNSL